MNTNGIKTSKPDARKNILLGDLPHIGRKPAVSITRRRSRPRWTVSDKPTAVWKHARAMSDAST